MTDLLAQMSWVRGLARAMVKDVHRADDLLELAILFLKLLEATDLLRGESAVLWHSSGRMSALRYCDCGRSP